MAKTKKPRRFLRWMVWCAASVVLVLIFCGSLAMILIQTRRVPEELKRPPPELAAFERPVAGHGVQVSPRSSDHPHWDRPDPPKTIEDYIRFQLERNPNDEGAKLYLELIEQFDGEFVNQWHDLFGGEPKPLWRPGAALDDAQRLWLIAHRDWIAKLRRMIAAGGPPLPSPEEIPHDDVAKRVQFPFPNFQFFSVAAMILDAESERLREANDPAGAADVLLDGYSLGREMIGQRLFGQLVASGVRSTTDRALAAWIGGDPPDVPILKRIGNTLDALHDVTRRRTWNMADSLAESRMAGIYFQEQPVSNLLLREDPVKLFGYRQSHLFDYLYQLHVDPGQTIERTVDILRSKSRAEENVREFDAMAIEAMKRLQGPYSAVLSGEWPPWDEISRRGFNPFSMWIPNYTESITRTVAAETGTNLNRSAVRLLQGEKPAPALGADPNSDAWLDSPWRDPFTEAPLRIEDEGSKTLIYSLGPDLKDQGGMISYDPSNGTLSAGDLAIRFVRR